MFMCRRCNISSIQSMRIFWMCGGRFSHSTHLLCVGTQNILVNIYLTDISFPLAAAIVWLCLCIMLAPTSYVAECEHVCGVCVGFNICFIRSRHGLPVLLHKRNCIHEHHTSIGFCYERDCSSDRKHTSPFVQYSHTNKPHTQS